MKDGKPIDTAPKDGSEFLAFDPVSRRFDVMFYDEHFFGSRASRGAYTSTQSDIETGQTSDEFNEDRATLWWRLPEIG